jgi:hypothetical protein
MVLNSGIPQVLKLLIMTSAIDSTKIGPAVAYHPTGSRQEVPMSRDPNK